jgi:hypothetical protein
MAGFQPFQETAKYGAGRQVSFLLHSNGLQRNKTKQNARWDCEMHFFIGDKSLKASRLGVGINLAEQWST